MAKRRQISDTELQGIIRAEIANCSDASTTQLSKERTDNLNYYFGRPLGTEIDGRSQVVSTVVADTIEWILPVLIRIFCSGDAIEFSPQTQADEEGAKQATDYILHVWNKDNEGFKNFYQWFKDALLSKDGIIKISWDPTPTEKRQKYYGLDDDTFTSIVNDDDVEVAEHTEREETIEFPPGLLPEGQEPPAPVKIAVHDVVVTRKVHGGKVVVAPVPPEEFLISKDARSIKDARLVGHKRLRTISDLIESGFPRSKVENLSGDDQTVSANTEETARNTVEDQTSGDAAANNAMRQIWVTEAYINIDVDGDGIAEMRKVTVAGSGDDILDNVAWDMPRPFAHLTPIIMPHRFHGRAVADLVKDLQLIHSTLFRQYLDNLYLMNNQREEVVEAWIVEPSEVLSSTPGGKIRVKQKGAITPIIVQPIGQQALEGLNYVDQVRENRTGVSPRTQGMGVDNLHDTASGERMMMNSAMGKIELIARVFAETGVKDAFRMILRLICEYQDKPRTIRLRDKWVPMDPRSWNADMDMEATVAISAGDRDQQLQHGMLLAKLQTEAYQVGMVTPDNFMETCEIIINAMGLKGVERFFSKPDPNKPQQKDPKAEAMMAKVQADSQAKGQELQMNSQAKQQEMQMDAMMKKMEATMDMYLKKYQIDAEIGLKQSQIASDQQLRREEIRQAPQIAHIHASAKPKVSVGGKPG